MSTVTFNIIMLVCMYPLLPIMYFIIRNTAKPKKNLVLGVTLPYDARQDERVDAICRGFKKRLGLVSLVLAVLPVSFYFTKHISVTTTFYMTWLLVVIIVPFVPYARYHGKLKRLKQEQNWKSIVEGSVLVDTKVSFRSQKELSVWLFVPPVVFSLIPVGVWAYRGTDLLSASIYIVNAVLVGTFYFLYRILYRQNAEVIDTDTSLSGALTNVRRFHWRRMWLWLAWLTGLFNLIFWLFITNETGVIVTTGIYVIAILAVAMNAEFKARKSQEALTAQSGQGVYADLDRYWILGLIYCNANDNHFIVNDRIGMGTSMNIAKPAGKAIVVFALVCMLAMPFMGLWMMSEEFTPPRINVTGEAIIAYHNSRRYEIAYGSISEVSLINELPPARRTNGSAYDNLLKGKFSVRDIGTCYLCLNPQVAPFMFIKAGETNYIIGADSPDLTIAAFNELSSILK